MNQVQLTLTITEINEILTALGQQPYAKVSALIGNIHTQANAQLNSTNTTTTEPVAEELQTAAN